MKSTLYIKKDKRKGRGVFCNRSFLKDEIIEECPLLIIPADEYKRMAATNLADYFFNFNKEQKTLALALGFGSLYNHACLPNACYSIDTVTQTITFYALDFIDKGKEMCINYSGKSGQDFKEWFTARNIEYCH